jgi:hypothetical protein
MGLCREMGMFIRLIVIQRRTANKGNLYKISNGAQKHIGKIIKLE